MKAKRARGALRLRPAKWENLWVEAKALMRATQDADGARVDLSPTALHHLGQCLLAVATGTPATEVFGQVPGKGIPSRQIAMAYAARVYWRNRTDGTSQSDAAAAALARWPKGEGPAPSVKTLIMFAGKISESALDAAEGVEYSLDEELQPQKRVRGKSATSVRISVAARSRRGR